MLSLRLATGKGYHTIILVKDKGKVHPRTGHEGPEVE